jgi:regulator of nucleoside diphosphate kinase
VKDLSLIVTDADMDKLTRLVRALNCSLFRDQQQLDLLDRILENAEVRPQSRVPSNVIRMNSIVRVHDFETREKESYTLVFPEDANISRGWISVLAPLGIALLGHRQGDLVEAKVPGGVRKLKVERVRQGLDLTKKKPLEDHSVRRTNERRRNQQIALAV